MKEIVTGYAERGSHRILIPFTVSEKVKISQHSGPKGQQHKGGAVVITTDGNFDDSGERGTSGKAQCIMPGCDYTEEIKAIGK